MEQLHAEVADEQQHDLLNLLESFDGDLDCLKIEFDLGDLSNRQRKLLQRNPVAYLVKKMRDSEVSLTRLSAVERALFERAKAKEVDSFCSSMSKPRRSTCCI